MGSSEKLYLQIPVFRLFAQTCIVGCAFHNPAASLAPVGDPGSDRMRSRQHASAVSGEMVGLPDPTLQPIETSQFVENGWNIPSNAIVSGCFG